MVLLNGGAAMTSNGGLFPGSSFFFFLLDSYHAHGVLVCILMTFEADLCWYLPRLVLVPVPAPTPTHAFALCGEGNPRDSS